MNELARRRAYWLTRLLREHGWSPADLARHAVWPSPCDRTSTPTARHRARAQLLREWGKSGDPGAKHPCQPRDAVLLAVARALGVDAGIFYSPIPA